ncbi:hypothetical protein KUCAC02_032959 [Chaenocephalus aceratus]|nr:hypothetical protein KUCAC02_032959 [Chaenocephalus aceratus]
MSIRAYVSAQMGVPGKPVGVMFTPLTVKVWTFLQRTRVLPSRTKGLTYDRSQVRGLCGQGSGHADPPCWHTLMMAEHAQLQHQRPVDGTYLSNLTQAQIALNEKLVLL